MEIKFAIFDMDGTLVDSMGYWNRLADEYLARFGLPGLSPALKEESIALTMLESAQLFIREFGLPGAPEQIAGEINALMEEHYRTDVPLKPGAAELLARLKGKGYVLALASSKPEELCVSICKRFGFTPHLSAIVGSPPLGDRSKADVIREAMAQLGLTEADRPAILMVGDRKFDVLGARECGVDCVGVRFFGYAPPGELEDAGAIAVAETVEELEAFITSELKGRK